MTSRFLPTEFEPPSTVWLDRFLVRPLRFEDADVDFECYMSCVDHVRDGGFIQPPGGPLDWPRHDQPRRWATVLLGHAEFQTRSGHRVEYGLFDLDETKEYGCLYVGGTGRSDFDAAATFWIRLDHYEALDQPFYEFCRTWLPSAYPFVQRFAYPGRDRTWDAWLALRRPSNDRSYE